MIRLRGIPAHDSVSGERQFIDCERAKRNFQYGEISYDGELALHLYLPRDIAMSWAKSAPYVIAYLEVSKISVKHESVEKRRTP